MQFESRDIIVNVAKLSEGEYFGINNDNMNDREKLTFENVVLLVI